MSEFFRKQLKRYAQDIINIVSGSDSGGGGWGLTGTTTLTGNAVVDTDGNTLEFNGDVVIKNSINDDEALRINSTLNSEVSYLKAKNETGDGNAGLLYASTTDTLATASVSGDFNDGVKNASVSTSANATEGIITLYADDGIKADDAIFPFADNAAAVAAIGIGKMYYTDVSGEYLLKLSH